MHEDQIDLIEEYTNIEHIKCVLEELQKGVRRCEKLFINPGSEGSSGSRSSLSESATANALEEEEANEQLKLLQHLSTVTTQSTLMTYDGADSMVLTNSTCNQSSLYQKTILQASPTLLHPSGFASPPDATPFSTSSF